MTPGAGAGWPTRSGIRRRPSTTSSSSPARPRRWTRSPGCCGSPTAWSGTGPSAAPRRASRAGRGLRSRRRSRPHAPTRPRSTLAPSPKQGKERRTMANINRVVLVGNLTRDPELRHTPSGMAVCSLRLAVNTRRKDQATGEWTEKPNYFDITVWGNQGENCAQYLAKGRPVAIDGRLEWREWDAQDGTKRQAVEVIGDTVQFLGGRGEGGDCQPQFVPAGAAAQSESADFGAATADDDIPF